MQDPTINAFAMLGGYISINSGLLLAARANPKPPASSGMNLAN